jgi:hypothetical protein
VLSTALTLAASDLPAAPVVGLMTFGVVMAIFGHAAKNTLVAAIGIAILFLATAAMMIGGVTAFDQDPSDPRPCGDIKAACK